MARKLSACLSVALVSALTFAATNAAADDPITLTRVTVVAKGGGNVICTGAACMEFIGELQQEEADLWPSQTDDPVPPMDELPIDKAVLCQRLKDSKPAGCDINDPPSVPGYDQSWQPNGCGIGPRSNWFIDKIMGSPLFSNYSDDLDAPGGVSFLTACNRHDQCWAQGFDRTFCDQRFEDEMESKCEVLTDPNAFGTCDGFASLYHSAVSPANTVATIAYNVSSSDATCAAWAHDMLANSCPQ